jgi:cobalt-zinc-cadmium efflux system outer membrane protein
MKIIYALLALLLYGSALQAQTDTLDFGTYLRKVGQHNLGYAAEKFNTDIAAANVISAKVFPDPELSAGVFDNGQRRMQMGSGFSSGLSWTLELGGKRHARIDLAKGEQEVTRLMLEDYFRNLRADATLAYLQAMQQASLNELKRQSWEFMWQLAQADSIRFRAGAITETDARQSKLEAGTLLNDVYQGAADLKTALLQLNSMLGYHRGDTLMIPAGDFSRFQRSFVLPELVSQALSQRMDLLAALHQRAVSRKTLQLAKSARMIDLGLNAGLNSAGAVTNVVAPTPSMNTVSAGITLPLKFSNRYKGEIKAANAGIHQADISYQQSELQVQTEVTQAYFNYQATTQQLAQFDAGLLEEAKQVLTAKIYSYKRGETTLLEVLVAQRTYNDVQQQYFETRYNHAAALVELERAVAIWDIEF